MIKLLPAYDFSKAGLKTMKGKFESGELFLSAGVKKRVSEDKKFSLFVYNSFHRHTSGDWGDCDPADAKENNFSVNKNLRIVSVYKYGDEKIWAITEADRKSTIILLPSEY